MRNNTRKKTKYQNARDKNAHMLCHSIEKEQNERVSPPQPNKKFFEALIIKNKQPSLSKQDKSIPLQLFNRGIQLLCCFSLNNH